MANCGVRTCNNQWNDTSKRTINPCTMSRRIKYTCVDQMLERDERKNRRFLRGDANRKSNLILTSLVKVSSEWFSCFYSILLPGLPNSGLISNNTGVQSNLLLPYVLFFNKLELTPPKQHQRRGWRILIPRARLILVLSDGTWVRISLPRFWSIQDRRSSALE